MPTQLHEGQYGMGSQSNITQRQRPDTRLPIKSISQYSDLGNNYASPRTPRKPPVPESPRTPRTQNHSDPTVMTPRATTHHESGAMTPRGIPHYRSLSTGLSSSSAHSV
eukprot:2963765-Rhodomonas_salina.1